MTVTLGMGTRAKSHKGLVSRQTTPDMGKCMKKTTACQVQCCFTSAETSRTIWDRELRTATSTFIQPLSSSSVLLYVHRNHKAYWGRVAQDGHFDFHTAHEFEFNVALRPQKPKANYGRVAQDGHLDFHTAPELCSCGYNMTVL